MLYKWTLVQIKRLLQWLRKSAFGGTYFRDIDSGINGKWYRKSRKEFDQLKNIQVTLIN